MSTRWSKIVEARVIWFTVILKKLGESWKNIALFQKRLLTLQLTFSLQLTLDLTWPCCQTVTLWYMAHECKLLPLQLTFSLLLTLALNLTWPCDLVARWGHCATWPPRCWRVRWMASSRRLTWLSMCTPWGSFCGSCSPGVILDKVRTHDHVGQTRWPVLDQACQTCGRRAHQPFTSTPAAHTKDTNLVS